MTLGAQRWAIGAGGRSYVTVYATILAEPHHLPPDLHGGPAADLLPAPGLHRSLRPS